MARVAKQNACLLIFLIVSVSASGQNATNPVQVTSNLTPPYSLYLSDYSDASQNKWNIQLLLKDFTQTNYQAKLRVTIEGAGIRLRTRQGFSPGPIRLDPGLPYQVDATDLGHYLNIQNMEVSGINRNQLASTQKLPEGFYQFKVEVLDYNRNNRVSNIGTSMAWLVLNDPPLLNLPFEEKLRIQDPQQVQFQWTPRHTSSPNSAFETEYLFRLWEIWPEGRNPNEVARTTQPLFERTIMTTSYFYGLNDAMLIPGRSYAWQVQAINLNGRDLFKNQGKSEVRWFKYGDECLPITNLGAEALGTDRIRITWEGKWNHNQFVAQIRKTGEEEWINYGTNIETQVVYDLQASTEYQIRVLPSCGAIEGTVENTLTLSTPEQNVEDFDCGAEADLPTIENREPIEQLQIGDRITAAGFTVILTELNRIGDTYTGMGFIEVPLFNSARVEAMLNDIQVNTDKQLIGGTVESTLNPNGPFILDLDPDEELSEEGGSGEGNNDDEEEIDDLPDTDIDIEGEIEDVEYNEEDSTITVTNTEGNTREIDLETADENEDGNIVIEDDEGNVYVVGDDGEVSGPHNSGGEPSGEEGNSEEIWFEYEELQYQSGTEIILSNEDSSHIIRLVDYNAEKELIWSVFNEDEDITNDIFLENPTNTETANIILPNDYDEVVLNIRIGEADNSIRLINNNDSNAGPTSGISRNPELLVINELTSSFTSSEERLELTYTYLDSLELNNSKIEIFKVNEEDTTLVIFYDDLEKGSEIEFVDTQDNIAGWSGKGTDNNFVEAGEYLLRITVSVDDSFTNGFEDYEVFEVEGANEPDFPIDSNQLDDIFPNTDEERIEEVVDVINEFSNDFNLNTKKRMAHFLGQVGHESNSFSNLVESHNYSAETIYNIFLKVRRSKTGGGYTYKYCHLIDGYECSDLSNCPDNYNGPNRCSTEPVWLTGDDGDFASYSSWTEEEYEVKTDFVNSSNLFNLTYCCRLGNGSYNSGDGSKYRGRGFIQLTGKDKYDDLSDLWNEKFPDDEKDFAGDDYELVGTDVRVAMLVAMFEWKRLEDSDDSSFKDALDGDWNDENIKTIGRNINGSGNSKANGEDDRIDKSKNAYENL